MQKNLFIAFEGIDGSGKSTQVKLLAEKLSSQGHKVYTTFEPTGSTIGKLIRDIFAHKEKADHRTIAALFVADRLDHILHEQDGLLKKLEEGYTVITDRYYFSSYAYHGTHMSMDWVIAANALSAQLLRPDLTIYIDIDPGTSMERISKGRASTELYETLDNLKQVRAKYMEAFEKLKDQERIFIADGRQAPEQVAEAVLAAVNGLTVAID